MNWKIGCSVFCRNEVTDVCRVVPMSEERRMHTREHIEYDLYCIGGVLSAEENPHRISLLKKVRETQFIDEKDCIAAVLELTTEEASLMHVEQCDGVFSVASDLFFGDPLEEENDDNTVFSDWFGYQIGAVHQE